jgi:hypothetical protein
MMVNLSKQLFSLAKLNVILLLFIFLFSSLPGTSQIHKTINLDEITQRKVRKYIVSRKIDQMPDFSSIHASWKKGIDESVFNVIEKTFYLKYKLSNVWECYKHANPVKSWNGHSVRFGLLILKRSNSVVYSDNTSFPAADTGQVYFLNLRFIRGLFKIPMAFEIINIDNKRQIMEFSYIDKNKSLGKQTLEFFDNGQGRTKIVHRSYFYSNSSLRDNLLYPYFHNRVIKEYHRNMRHFVKNEMHSVTV